MAEIHSLADDSPLFRRWLNVVYMRSRISSAPLSPTWKRFQEVGPPGHGWLDLMEQWEREGCRGEKPLGFEAYVASFMHRAAG